MTTTQHSVVTLDEGNFEREVLYLADAEFVTGVVLPVDGGVAAGGK